MSRLSRLFIAGVNHVLADAGWARERLVVHPGRSIRLRADPFDVRFTIAPDGTFMESAPDAVAEVTLSVPLAQAPQFLVGDMSRAMSAVRIEGSADLADAVGFVFRNLRWDVEEDLARVVGDIPAHRLTLAAQSVRRTHARTWEAIGANLSEYFAEEQGLLLTQRALAGFADELRALRDDVARLDKRISRFEAHAKAQTRPNAK